MHERRNAARSERGRKSLRANVGDAVAFRIGAADARRPGQICAEAVGRAQARPFADQDQGERSADAFADFVRDRDARLGDHAQRRETPAFEQRQQCVDYGSRVAIDSDCGEPIGDDDHGVEIAARDFQGGIGAEAAAEIGAAKIFGAIARGAVEGRGPVAEGFVNRVAGAGVGELKREKLAGREAVAGAAECDASGGELAECGPGVGKYGITSRATD